MVPCCFVWGSRDAFILTHTKQRGEKKLVLIFIRRRSHNVFLALRCFLWVILTGYSPGAPT